MNNFKSSKKFARQDNRGGKPHHRETVSQPKKLFSFFLASIKVLQHVGHFWWKAAVDVFKLLLPPLSCFQLPVKMPKYLKKYSPFWTTKLGHAVRYFSFNKQRLQNCQLSSVLSMNDYNYILHYTVLILDASFIILQEVAKLCSPHQSSTLRNMLWGKLWNLDFPHWQLSWKIKPTRDIKRFQWWFNQ